LANSYIKEKQIKVKIAYFKILIHEKFHRAYHNFTPPEVYTLALLFRIDPTVAFYASISLN
jgi:hypothetical protein